MTKTTEFLKTASTRSSITPDFKYFSFPLYRKHHCRNCGQIFCADCSSKRITMSNFKNPQRVCDGCHAEIQQSKWQIGNPNRLEPNFLGHNSSIGRGQRSQQPQSLEASAVSNSISNETSNRRTPANLWNEQVH